LDEVQALAPVFNACSHTTGNLGFWEGRRRRSFSPDTGQQEGIALCGAHIACACGEAGRVALVWLLIMKLVCSAPRAPGAVAIWRAPAFAVAVAAALIASASHAQDLAPATATPSPSVNLPQVVVIASREPQPRDQVTADVIVIDAQRIRDTAADSLEDLLRREAGLQVVRYGGPGQAAGVLIRGVGSQGTVVLIDGVRVGSATLGQVAFDSISMSQIDRIEVLRGPASSLYGADAVGGVVRITTLRGQGPASASARLAVGGYDSFEGDAAVSGSTGRFDYAASLSYEGSDGVSAVRPSETSTYFYNPDRDGFDRRTAQLSLGHTLVPGHRVSLNLSDAHLKSHYDGGSGPDDYINRVDTQVISVGYDGVWSPIWTTRVQLAFNEDDAKQGASAPERSVTRRDQYTWQNAFTLAAGHEVVAVLERLDEKAEQLNYLSDKKRTNDAFGLGYSGRFGSNLVSLDVRRDDNSVYGGNNTGRIGLGHDFGQGLSVRALAGTTFRAPAFNDLYYSDYGVDSLQPERGRSIELGLDWRVDQSSASLTVYRNRVKDLISYQDVESLCPSNPNFNYEYGCATNVGRALLQGASLTATHQIDALSLRAVVDLLNAKDDDTGARLHSRARHQETLSADYQIRDWTLGGTVMVVGDRTEGDEVLGSYTTIDLQARWRLTSQWRLEAKVLNLTDRDIEYRRDYRSLGRQGWIGVRYSGVGF
jgi:vitamin B12 transporter